MWKMKWLIQIYILLIYYNKYKANWLYFISLALKRRVNSAPITPNNEPRKALILPFETSIITYLNLLITL